MSRNTFANINLAALQHNLSVVKQAAPASKILTVIKANAYGHGIVQVAKSLQQADAFAVATIDEAIRLREAGLEHPVVLLEGLTQPGDHYLAAQHDLQLVVHHAYQVDMLEQLAADAAFTVWLKIDTGMHRLGIDVNVALPMLKRLQACRNVKDIYLMTHFACADDKADKYTQQQIDAMQSFTHQPECAGVPVSQANSGGILGWPGSHAQWVRPGIMLYGVSPFNNQLGAEHNLKPVMSLYSELIAINQFKKGDQIGYSGTWTCPEDMPLGVVAIGYGDGYPRHAQAGTPVLINGKRVPLVGRVSMDMICVDLRELPDAKVGDKVTLWGEGLPVEEIAQHAGTIAYELLCKVTSRVKFNYLD